MIIILASIKSKTMASEHKHKIIIGQIQCLVWEMATITTNTKKKVRAKI